MRIRPATAADLPQILTIANHAIAHTTAIWDTEPVDLAERRTWFDARTAAGHPILVAEMDGAVAGYASYGQFRPKSGFARTVENSVYVATAFQRRGIATALLGALVEAGRERGAHVMVACIESENVTSVALHAKFGFTVVGVMPEVGRKFGRWLDLTIMQRAL